MDEPVRYYGKYRGTVTGNTDPMRMGRLQVQVPDVHGSTPATWAMPCVPSSGMGNGMLWLPPIGAGVWVEFEQGNPDYPIWVGGWWGSASEVPALAQTAPPSFSTLAIQTTQQNGLLVTDLPGPTGGIVLRSSSGASIIVNDTGVYIQNGQGASITLVGPTVTVNSGALAVT
jgi:uncharacterized protein involved in type VI secretion and phage assembly